MQNMPFSESESDHALQRVQNIQGINFDDKKPKRAQVKNACGIHYSSKDL